MIAISYLFLTVPELIDNMKCATCTNSTLIYFDHYWYRWCLYSILVFASYRLYYKMVGARRLYYIFFTGATIVAILDIMSGFYDMTAYDIALDVVMPIGASIVGVLYFMSIYKATLKYR